MVSVKFFLFIYEIVTANYLSSSYLPVMNILAHDILEGGADDLTKYDRRSIMKVSQAIEYHLHYHKTNSKKKYRQDL